MPVHAFVEDVAASGGYWLATAADDIHVDPNSIVGSIGVISASFGFQDLIARHGIERRVHTAGEDKSLLDPFRPERPEDVERLTRLQAAIHANFIGQVRARRGARLAGRRPLHRRGLGRRGGGRARPRRRDRPPRPGDARPATATSCASGRSPRAGRCSAGSASRASATRSTRSRPAATGAATG